MRNNNWLALRLSAIHSTYFPDIKVSNVIMVKFGRRSRTRFGSIIAKTTKGHGKPVTFISINSLFKDESVPEFVIDATLAHEFVHYAHGFHSPLAQLYTHPHRGDIVNKEIRKRGAGHLLDQQTAWTKKEYRQFLHKHNLL